MANGTNAAVESDPVERRSLRHRDTGGGAGVSRFQRLAREQAQDVGKQKLLVLLLMIDAELDQLSRPLVQAGGAERLPGTHALVIGVEAIFEALVKNPVVSEESLQHESFEEPGGVREMPFGGTCVVVGLDDLVLVAQRKSKFRGEPARGDQALEKRF